MSQEKLIVNTGKQKYAVLIGSDIITKTSTILTSNSIKFKKCLLVIDKNVPKKKLIYLKSLLKIKKFFPF